MMTNKSNVVIRSVVPTDAETLLAIYAPYVEKTAITFEYEVPSVDEFRKRIEHTLERYPYLVAECSGEAVGYCYAGVFKGRSAYDWAVETTIYIAEGWHGMGIGRMLYDELEAALKRKNIVNLYACIAYTEIEDEYLTLGSVRFHERCGYRLIGRFHQCGYKFRRWYDMVWMEKMIGEHLEEQPEVVWKSESI